MSRGGLDAGGGGQQGGGGVRPRMFRNIILHVMRLKLSCDFPKLAGASQLIGRLASNTEISETEMISSHIFSVLRYFIQKLVSQQLEPT